MKDVFCTVFEMIINYCEGFLYIGFCRTVFHERKKSSALFFFFSVLIGSAYSAYMYADIPVADTWVLLLIPLLYSLICFDDPLPERIFWIILMDSVVIGITDVLYALYYRVFGSEILFIMEDGLRRIPVVLLTNLFIGAGLQILIRQKRKSLYEFRSLVLLVAINLSCLGLMNLSYYLYDMGYCNENHFFILAALSFFTSAASVVLYRVISTYVARENERQSAELLVRNAEDKLRELSRYYEVLRGIRHDLNNHINVIVGLYSEGKEAEGEEYVRELKNRIVETYVSGNSSVDALLAFKASDMKQAGIRFLCTLENLSELPVNTSTFCAVLGNLLDNAMEALLREQKKTTDPYIEFVIRRSRNQLIISCENPVNENTLLMKNGEYVTSKKDGLHGLGIRNIKMLVRENGGTCDFSVRNGRFSAHIWFPFL